MSVTPAEYEPPASARLRPLRDPEYWASMSPRRLNDAIEGWREIVAKHQKNLDDAQGLLDNLLAIKEQREREARNA